MRCEWCGEIMLEDEAFVSGGMVKLKNVSVLHCMKCGRVEYRSKDGVRLVTGSSHRSMSGKANP